MRLDVIESILSDEELLSELKEKLFSGREQPNRRPLFFEGFELEDRQLSPRVLTPQRINADPVLEAIVLRFGRPSLLIEDSKYQIPESEVWSGRLDPYREFLEQAIPSVGRVELTDHELSWAGTGWVIADDVIVTNRHVADLFAQREGGGFVFRRNPGGFSIGAHIDFRAEFRQKDVWKVNVAEIIYVAENDGISPDLGFLRLRGSSDPVPPPIRLSVDDPYPGQCVAVIGYPAYDSRNDPGDQDRIFADVYGVKRFAPGGIRVVDDHNFTHDCSTLGGNSGSVVIDVRSGQAVGLHFAGRYLKTNYAVSARTLRRYLDDKVLSRSQIAASVAVTPPYDGSGEAPQPLSEDLKDRKGYNPAFLGRAKKHHVPLPKVASGGVSAAADVTAPHVLPYTNFTVVMNPDRRMAAFTATNIDGSRIQRTKRKSDHWYFDPRIPRERQLGNELYSSTDLDRGHLTRRLDPVWGPNYETAENDTFFFTNCTPQHRSFNRKIWLGIEDHLLGSSETLGFRMSVFTGPIFSDTDRRYSFTARGGKQDEACIPFEYWKVVVMINAATRNLSATGYILSQKDLVMEMEFVFGQYKTYQVAVSKIESETGLDFGDLRESDPLGNVETSAVRDLISLEDIVI
jgi:endonuclease G